MDKIIPVINQMLFLFTCILIGYYLKKTNKLPDNSATVLSKLENEIIVPAMLISSFSTNFTVKSLSANMSILLYGLFFTAIQVVISLILTPYFTKDGKNIGIYKYSLAVVNFSFMGNSLILGLYGNEMLFKYLIFSMPMLILVFSFGVAWLTGSDSKFSFKSLVNPTMISMVIGMAIGLLNIPLPTFVNNVLSSLTSCFSPLAMILTGLVIGGFDIKKLFGDKKIYVLTIVRCLIIPVITLSIVKAINLDETIRILLVFLCGMPLGLNTIVFPASIGGDTKPGAAMAVVSNIIGLILVPIIILLFA